MYNYESNGIVLRTILSSCLSNINKLIPLSYYGILLPEKKDANILFVLKLIIVLLKQILESCGLITIKDNNFKFVLDTSSHGGKYS